MASVTKSNDENTAGGDAQRAAAAGGDAAKAAKADLAKSDKGGAGTVEYAKPATRPGGGFFTVYKSGQGYWTRMGTLIAVAVLGLLLAYTLYDRVPVFFNNDPARGRRVGLGVAAGFLIAYVIIALRLMNKPSNVDFLIATDSEMKKVNWTSRRELIGSTKVVVMFMLLIAGILFLVDQVFHVLFWGVGVLNTPPFWWPQP